MNDQKNKTIAETFRAKIPVRAQPRRYSVVSAQSAFSASFEGKARVIGPLNYDEQTAAGEMSEKNMYAQLVQLKNKLEAYVKDEHFDAALSFGYFLNEYIKKQHKRDKCFAKEIGVTDAAVSQYLNNRRKPTRTFLVRLELHSNNLLPAILWFKLLQKEKEHELISDSRLRMQESKYVSNKLRYDLKL